MTEQRSYHAPGVDVEALGDALSHWYQSQGYLAYRRGLVGGP